MRDAALTAWEGAVPPAILELARTIGREAVFAAGHRLFSVGQRAEGLHLITAGEVRIIRESEGRAVVLHRETAGGLLGEAAFFGDGTYPGTAVAVEATEARFLPAEGLRRELRTNTELAAVFLERLARRTSHVIRRLDAVAHQTVLRRLARHLKERQGRARDGSRHISLGMTLVELADELGTVKEVVVRELRTLRRLRIIEPAGRGLYRIVDPPGLRILAGRE